MERVEGKCVYLFKLGETSSIYLSPPPTMPFNSDIFKKYIVLKTKLAIIISTSFLFLGWSAIKIKLY